MTLKGITSYVQTAMRILLVTVCVGALGTSSAFAQNNSSPTAAVQTVVDSILVILRSPEFEFESARPLIRAEIQRAFDDVAMAQSVLSTNWRTASKEQQTEFKDLLMRTIESTYIGRIRAYTNESVDFRGEEIKEKRATVDTAILAASGEIPILYKLRQRSDGWFVYDVEIENVSMVSTYRETYRSVVKKSGMDGLLQQMREKLAELQAKENLPPA